MRSSTANTLVLLPESIPAPVSSRHSRTWGTGSATWGWHRRPGLGWRGRRRSGIWEGCGYASRRRRSRRAQTPGCSCAAARRCSRLSRRVPARRLGKRNRHSEGGGVEEVVQGDTAVGRHLVHVQANVDDLDAAGRHGKVLDDAQPLGHHLRSVSWRRLQVATDAIAGLRGRYCGGQQVRRTQPAFGGDAVPLFQLALRVSDAAVAARSRPGRPHPGQKEHGIGGPGPLSRSKLSLLLPRLAWVSSGVVRRSPAGCRPNRRVPRPNRW